MRVDETVQQVLEAYAKGAISRRSAMAVLGVADLQLSALLLEWGMVIPQPKNDAAGFARKLKEAMRA